MKILLDECLPRKLKHELTEHEVSTAQEMGWAGIKNGALLRLMEPNFDVFVTADRNLSSQQNLVATTLRIIVLVAPKNTLNALLPLMPNMRQALTSIQQGQILSISVP